ncbi:Glycerol-3-phosphate dehydrogenase [Chondrus crispus]|uniref:Glycerol-3-phosphate dehydrogenase [NAD(+)] n=1 Tax=Chondrus crispus TaxID=2769 RepID=R7QRH6_CHOCR|nr:Glycerol-3-phosphate dehydrogenase [Chondrus crispus]CDF40086.1 Glycerol-3-phosphate dehydrogenase [Chondrus crispus]|eukprot:XP_005710380.1 Glycerol-3-phosphate dehydrogenase [Chondrus crispus]
MPSPAQRRPRPAFTLATPLAAVRHARRATSRRPPRCALPPNRPPSHLRPSEGVYSEEDWLVRSRIRRSPQQAAQTKVVVCGGGSFGTAMANLLARNGYPVSLLVRKAWVSDEINMEHRNPKYLSEYLLPDNLTATTDPAAAFRDAKLCVHAVPVQVSREFVTGIAPFVPPHLPVLCTSKGLEISRLELMCDLLPTILGTERKYAYLSGPSFAKEIIQGLPTAVVVASADHTFANSLCDMLSSPSFMVFTSTDTVGLEVAGAIKNVIAIAAGMSDGLGLGTNSMAALVTRGCSEMRRIAIAQGASPVTLAGLSGVGDTFLTCFGPLSRNRTVGVRLGRGEKLEDILSTSMQIAEGVATAKALNSPMAIRASLKYPILYGVAAILDGKITPREGLHMLLAMPPRPED